MPRPKDPTEPIRKKAVTFPAVDKGTSCNQGSFKVGKTAFLYIGPGAKGQGFKAMFKLERSRAQAEQLARKEPERFGVGSTSWVTTRFTADEPLPKAIWEKWLKESYQLAVGSESSTKVRTEKVTKRAAEKAAKRVAKKTAKKSVKRATERTAKKTAKRTTKKRSRG